MAEEPDRGKPEPTLELPSLFHRRRKQRAVPGDDAPADSPEPEPEPEPAAPPAEAPRRKRSGPLLPVWPAVVLVGLLVGLAGTGMTYGGLRGCEAVTGTESCGKPGFLGLVAVLVVMVLLGVLLLRLLRVPDGAGTSLLGVGLLCVVVLVALMEAVFSAWMFLVVPLVCAATYAVARWVTTRFVELDEPGPGPDVR